ncbi:MAG TPA: hypothetical protein VEU96_02265 [Bryobacteraceae bacterium]|nr:hypothetical protein [Bryobacteraceae bacterium]
MNWRPGEMGHGNRVKADLFPFGLLILPFLVLWRNSNLMFSGLGYIDPWVYYGFFRNLALFKGELFPDTYYGSRLSWIVPGYLVNRLFEPLVANYALHLAVYYAAVLSLYFVLARTINRPTALLTAIVFGLHPYVWLATGGDYPDGASIAYYLLVLAMLTVAGDQPNKRWALVLAGVCYAALVYCNIVWLLFTPVFPAFYIFRKHVTNRLHELVRLCLWAGAGAAALTILLGTINYRVEHNFWFYAPSWHYLFSNVGKPNQHKANGLEWVSQAKWLMFPALALFAMPFALWRRLRKPFPDDTRAILVFSGVFLFHAALFGMVEALGSPMLEFPYSASLLLPSGFLVFGSLLLRIGDGHDPVRIAVLAAAAAVVLATPWWDLNGQLWRLVAMLGAGWVGVAAAVFLWRSLQPGSRAALAALLVAMVACGSLALWTDRYIMRAGPWRTGTEGRDGFLRITDAVSRIQAVKPDRSTRFWIDEGEPDGKELTSLTSVYLYGYTLLSRNFPSIPADVPVSSGSLVIIPSRRPDVPALARKALESRYLIPAVVSSNRIERGNVGYFLNILRVDRDPSVLQPLTLRTGGELAPASPGRADALPDDKWTLAGKSGTAQRVADGIAVTTPADRWGYAVYYNAPLTAPSDGAYLFALRFKLLSGRIMFGALKEDRSVWLAQAGEPVRRDDVLMEECTVALKAGQRIWLQTTNDQPRGDARSVFVIQEIKAYRLP